MEVKYAFWHRPEIRGWARLYKTTIGPYVVRRWLDHDGKVMATGWFTR